MPGARGMLRASSSPHFGLGHRRRIDQAPVRSIAGLDVLKLFFCVLVQVDADRRIALPVAAIDGFALGLVWSALSSVATLEYTDRDFLLAGRETPRTCSYQRFFYVGFIVEDGVCPNTPAPRALKSVACSPCSTPTAWRSISWGDFVPC